MGTGLRDRLFWGSWLLAVLFTSLAAGLMLGHALILAPFLSWMLAIGPPGAFGHTYPVFRSTAGAVGLTVYYVVAGLQVATVMGLVVAALAMRRHRGASAFAAMASLCWVIVHYGSGFGAVEARVWRNAASDVHRFVAWNTPIHFVYAGMLTVALLALLSVPLFALRAASSGAPQRREPRPRSN